MSPRNNRSQASPRPISAISMPASFFHIFVLVAFALQPLFDLLGRNPDFFIAHRARYYDILLIVLFLQLGISLWLVLVEMIFAQTGEKLRQFLHYIIVGILFAIIIPPLVIKLTPETTGFGVILMTYSLVLSTFLAFAYARYSLFRAFVSYCAPAILIFPGLFLFGSSASKTVLKMRAAPAYEAAPPILSKTGKVKPPIIMVVLDECSTVSLMDAHERIDSANYPNLSALAEESYWFRNATTVHAESRSSVAAILTGKYPDRTHKTDYFDSPLHLYSLLGKQYNLYIQAQAVNPYSLIAPIEEEESLESFVPRLGRIFSDIWYISLHLAIHPDLTGSLPKITEVKANFSSWYNVRQTIDEARKGKVPGGSRIAVFRRFIDELEPTGVPALYTLYSPLPHAPYEYMPSGKSYGARAIPCIGETGHLEWGSDAWAVTQAYQRYLLQLAAVDMLIGEMITKLKRIGLYNPALLIITADHGGSFSPGDNRRHVTATNYADIMSVPLFVKLPHQVKGAILDRKAETIDILPTIAHVLNMVVPWPCDGRSLLDHSLPDRATQTIYPHRSEGPYSYSDLTEKRRRSLRKKLSVFGTEGGGIELLEIGPYSSLAGSDLIEFKEPELSNTVIYLENMETFMDIDIQAPFIPSLITGRVSGEAARQSLPLLVAVNGTIAASTRSYMCGRDSGRFFAIIPEANFRSGRNVVDIFIPQAREGEIILMRPILRHHR